MIELLLLWCALAARSPNIEPNPFDYEASAGYEISYTFVEHLVSFDDFLDKIVDNPRPWLTIHSDFKILRERENGGEYSGRIHNHDLKYLKLGEYVKTAKNISKQSAVAKYPLVFPAFTVEMGAGLAWEDYRDNRAVLYGKFKSRMAEIEISGLKEIEIIKGKLKYNIPIGHFFIEPTGGFMFDGTIWDYQGKVKLGVRFAAG